MDFNSLAGIVDRMRPSFQSPEQQQLDKIARVWRRTFGDRLADRARPVRFERSILTVAVRQAIWSQQLAAQAYPILQKLGPQLPPSIAIARLKFWVAPHLFDDRDTTLATLPSRETHPSRWTEPALARGECAGERAIEAHPDVVDSRDRLADLTQRWGNRLDRPRPDVRPCPKCQSLTPVGELERWGTCAPCATTRFQSTMALGCQREPWQDMELELDPDLPASAPPESSKNSR